jgi:methylated-DNA-[protein]-cysteine S-methyltransferase
MGYCPDWANNRVDSNIETAREESQPFNACSAPVQRMKQKKTNPPAFCLRRTRFGPVAVVWSVYRAEPKICRILLSKPELSAKQAVKKFFPVLAAASCPEINILVDQIETFLNGANIQFSLDVVRLDGCSPFQQKVLRAEHAIARGRVSTYHLIAKHLKNPNGARAVGSALASNPFPIVIPCHRVIRSDGALGGYQGGVKMKRILLEMEGIAFRDAGHVASRSLFYEDSIVESSESLGVGCPSPDFGVRIPYPKP